MPTSDEAPINLCATLPISTQRPGPERMMRKKRTKETRYPGVKHVAPGLHLARATVKDPRTGRQLEKERLVHGTAAEASAVREQLRQELLEPTESEREKITLATYAKRWASRKKAELKPSTRERYFRALVHVVEAIGDVYLDRLTPEDFVRWRDAQTDAPSTINGRLRVVKAMMADATHEMRLDRNPTGRLRAVSESRPDTASTNMLNADELREVLAYLEEYEYHWYPFFLTAALTGARFGELSALKWCDIDHERGEITIQRAQVRKHVSSTKTGKSRTVPMPAPLARVLQGHRRNQLEQQAEALTEGWCFPSKVGDLMYPSSPTKPLKRALEAAGVERRVTFHGLRRTFNNLARQTASGQVVRAITGHVTEAMTEHYSHVGGEEKRQLADTLTAQIFALA